MLNKYASSLLRWSLCLILVSNWTVQLGAQRRLNATRTDQKIKIDAYASEEAWMQAQIAHDFTQLAPTPGDPASHQTHVRILYDDEAVYVLAHMQDPNPAEIPKELAQRDRTSNTDWFSVNLDTYRDGINAFIFRVSAAGVQLDARESSLGRDITWDAIWDSAVRLSDDGWWAEMMIPFSAVRFATEEVQTWGIQFGREIRKNREEVFWNPINPKIQGFVNQFGLLDGLTNIQSPIRLQLTPYVTGYLNTFSDPSGQRPGAADLNYSAGMDLKYGINDAFTLDMTLIPDFGQTISDNNVLNLSPFEVFFEENRQFFTEGLEIFNKGNLFYTRRIGGRPSRYFAAIARQNENLRLVSNPSLNGLLNATKISGRTNSGLGIGFFNALESEQFAVYEDSEGNTSRFQTNPLTNYNVLVVDQNLKNNSNVAFINTNTLRFGSDYDANVTAGFWNINDKSLSYNVSGKMAVSQIFENGSTDIGRSHTLSLQKISGNWRGGIGHNFESVNYRVNDLGFLLSSNENSFTGNISYTDFTPKNQKLNRWNVVLNSGYTRLHQPNVFSDFFVGGSTFVLYKDGLAYGGNFRLEPIETRDYFEPRTRDFSQYLTWPRNFGAGGFISTDYRKKFAADANVYYRTFDATGRKNLSLSFEPRVRFNDKFSLFWTVAWDQIFQEPGYVGLLDSPNQSGILMGVRNRQIVENLMTNRYIFNENMSLNVRLRHYWSRVIYQSFGLLRNVDGYLDDVGYDGINPDGSPIFDQNINLFNVDLQYQWRFSPGSDIFVVWKGNIANSDQQLNRNYVRNLKGIFDGPQENSISVRLVYFLDYQRIF